MIRLFVLMILLVWTKGATGRKVYGTDGSACIQECDYHGYNYMWCHGDTAAPTTTRRLVTEAWTRRGSTVRARALFVMASTGVIESTAK